MIVVDVDVLVYAARCEYAQHGVAHSWLTATLGGREPVAVLDEVMAATAATPGPGRWSTFVDRVREHDLRGNDVPDALLAAGALALGARLATVDRGFPRFTELEVVVPT